MINPDPRDHSESCTHTEAFAEVDNITSDGVPVWQCRKFLCPGGRKVTATEITEMAYSLWQAEQMDEYHRGVL